MIAEIKWAQRSNPVSQKRRFLDAAATVAAFLLLGTRNAGHGCEAFSPLRFMPVTVNSSVPVTSRYKTLRVL
jgi:hypothetical protein